MNQEIIEGIVKDTHPKKHRTGKAILITVIVLLAALLIAGVVHITLLLQDNVSHRYSKTPSLNALSRVVFELGDKGELTLTPQEMTDTVAYFLENQPAQEESAPTDLYFDVTEDGERALIVMPFTYMNNQLVLQMEVSIGIREVSATQRYFTATIEKTKIGELTIPPFLVDSYMKQVKFADFLSYREGAILVDSSFLTLDILGKKTTFQVHELSTVSDGYFIRTESLKDFLLEIVAEQFGGSN